MSVSHGFALQNLKTSSSVFCTIKSKMRINEVSEEIGMDEGLDAPSSVLIVIG